MRLSFLLVSLTGLSLYLAIHHCQAAGPLQDKTVSETVRAAGLLWNLQALDTRKLTFAYATRMDMKDDFSSSLDRLTCSLKLLLYGLEKWNLQSSAEIIVVDWSSDEPLVAMKELPKLVATLKGFCNGTKDNAGGCADLRVLTVNQTLSQKLVNHTDLVSEVHAYNLAVRRSKGSMFLRLDQDTLVGDPFFKFLAGQQELGWPLLSAAWFSSRRDSLDHQLKPILKDPLAFYNNPGDIEIWASKGGTLPGYTGGVGVFAVPRLVWQALYGYDERMIFWGHMELEMAKRLASVVEETNLDTVLDPICPFYHLHHGRKHRTQSNDEAYTRFMNSDHWGLMCEEVPDMYLIGQAPE